GSAVYLMFEAVQRLANPQPLPNGAIAIGVMVVSIVLTIALVLFQRHVVRQTASLAVRGDSVHYTSDVLVNTGVIVAILAVGATGQLWVDSVVGGAIALFILWSARTIARDAILMLMDREMPEGDRQRIRAIALAHAEVGSLHDLRTRLSGPTVFIQMHLEMDGDMSLRRAHQIADEVEAEIIAAFPTAEVLIHEDPEGEEEPPPRLA
ncbi:MAG: cation diffusion facilitator family transporter, partial [Alphaproteobacteria bacterium]